MRYVVLRDLSDARDRRYLAAELTSEGDLLMQGQDLGDGVEAVFGEGFREYEWAWTVRAAHVPKLLEALGAGGPVLAVLEHRFSGEKAAGLKQFLDDHEIPHESWSRMGD